jgi:hypothetical protein
MDLALAWIAFPAALLALTLGCGLLVARLIDPELPRALLPALGFALIVAVAGLLTLADATAELATPAVAGLAVAGLVVGRRSLARPEPWAVAAAAGVFAVYAAPIVLSGEATFAGYIRLDDTATWLALTDRALEHGRDLSGLAPSTYEATLAFNLGDGYPIGVFLPFGVAAGLVGGDLAWLIQPYMAVLAVSLALALWSLARPLVSSGPLRAATVFVGAQSALLFGYYLWGGIKEVAAAMMIAAVGALSARLVAERMRPRTLAPVALLAAALAGSLSGGGLVWVLPGLALVAAPALRGLGPRVAGARLVLFGGLVAAFALPVLVTGGLLPPTSSPLTDAGASGNLIGAVEPAQVAGVWPAGDFRLDPVAELPAALLIALMVTAAAAGIAVAASARAWGALAYAGGTAAACIVICALGSPWVDGKALATASPVVPFAAGIAVAWLAARRFGMAAPALGLALATGVIWSNALAYRDANLAPREQLAELERVGDRIAGQGPTLMTEYQPYGARHFLRDAEPEAVSELRRRRIALAGGATVAKGETADTDELEPAGLLAYRTLVLRRSPAQSRPPAVYDLRWRGDYYEIWQRPPGPPVRLVRLGLGRGPRPAGRVACSQIEELAAGARPGQRLVAAARAPAVVRSLAGARYPRAWSTPATRATPVPEGAGTVAMSIGPLAGGLYEIWLRGSVRPGVELVVDGQAAGSVRHQLNNSGQYVRLGEAELGPGKHSIAIRFAGADLHPGSGGASTAIGPLVLTAAGAAEATLVRVGPGRARTLCGHAWDWIELGPAVG